MPSLLPLATAAFVLVAAAPEAAADCAPTGAQPAQVRREVVFLGQVSDLLGHRASFYFDPAHRNVIGPVDHDAWPRTRRRARPMAATVPGTVGTLTLITIDPATGVISSGGWFERFAATKARRDVAAIAAIVDDPFALGLLAPTVPAAEAKVAALGKGASARDELVRAAQGMLYAASGARAQALLAPVRYRDIASTRLDWLATLRDGGVAALAKLTPPRNKQDWTDYLPELAAAFVARRDVAGALDALLLGQLTPAIPIDGSAMSMRRSCGPTREEIRGPFAGVHELTPIVVRDLVRQRSRPFAKAIEAAFASTSAGADQFVVAIRGDVVLVTGRSNDLTALRPGRPLALGTKLRYVARGPHERYLPIGHLDASESAIVDAGVAIRLDLQGKDVPAMIAVLTDHARSGSLPVHGGGALALLIDLAGNVPGWGHNDVRKLLAELPGNAYATPREWAQAWGELLAHAIRFGADEKVAAEVEHALPAILARFARPAHGRAKSALPAETVRRVATVVATEIVARRLIANDLDGAARIVDLARGPLAKIAGATAVTAETTRDSNDTLRLTTLAVLVGALRNKPVPLPPQDHRAHGLALFNSDLRAYAPGVRAPWIRALVAAGYPAPR